MSVLNKIENAKVELKVTLEGEDLETFNRLLTMLENIEDVTEVYHNVNLD